MADMTFKSPEAKAKIDTILGLLRAVPLNSHDLAELIPMSRRWTLAYLNHLHTRRRIYIVRWDKEIAQREKRHAVPVYAPGRKPDAVKPEPDGKTMRYERAWSAIKNDPERHMVTLAKRRTRRRLKSLRPDPAAAWFMTTPAAVEPSPAPVVWPFPPKLLPSDHTRPPFNPNNHEDAPL